MNAGTSTEDGTTVGLGRLGLAAVQAQSAGRGNAASRGVHRRMYQWSTARNTTFAVCTFRGRFQRASGQVGALDHASESRQGCGGPRHGRSGPPGRRWGGLMTPKALSLRASFDHAQPISRLYRSTLAHHGQESPASSSFEVFRSSCLAIYKFKKSLTKP